MKNSKKFHFVVFVFVFFFSAIFYAQDQKYILGKVLDVNTNEPVVFANIRVKDWPVGVISNMDGSFKIPLKYKKYGAIIEISSMGYKVMEIDLNDFNLNETNLLKLEPNIEILDEVVLVSKKKKSLKAKEIVLKAIKSIPENYPKYPFSYVGYYRDYQVKNYDLFNVNEAIIEVFDKGFQTNDNKNTNYKLFEYKRNANFSRDTLGENTYDNKKKFVPGAAILPRYGNELLMLRNMNAIRNYKVDIYSYVYRFERDFIVNHWLRKNKDVDLGDEQFYAISVSKTNPKFLVFGTMYISKTSFAIYKFDYEVYDRRDGIKSTASYETIKKEFSPLFAVRLGYKKQNGLMYPSFISFNNRFKVYGEPKFTIENLRIDSSEECVFVNFSREPNSTDVLKKGRYELQYEGEKVRILYIKQEGRIAKLYFSNKTWADLEERSSSNISTDEAKLTLSISDIKDVNGDIINTPEEIEFNQFREFFAQQSKASIGKPFVPGYMKKNLPIFKDQPIVKPDNFDDYWMNTPLQTIKN